jgi:drug/metabolite transporter (DMT)-like permease
MRVIDLKYFAALMSANYIAVALASRLVLKEKIGRRRAIGTLITAAGVLIFIMS